MKKWISALILGLTLIGLSACAPKSVEDIVKTELKDSYTGHSENPGYDSLLFTGGGSELVFDKENNTIKNGDEKMFFEVVSNDKIPKAIQGMLSKHKSELAGKSYFIINVGYKKNDIWGKLGDQLYCVILSDGGKSIRIFEFETGYTTDGYYNFTGTAN